MPADAVWVWKNIKTANVLTGQRASVSGYVTRLKKRVGNDSARDIGLVRPLHTFDPICNIVFKLQQVPGQAFDRFTDRG